MPNEPDPNAPAAADDTDRQPCVRLVAACTEALLRRLRDQDFRCRVMGGAIAFVLSRTWPMDARTDCQSALDDSVPELLGLIGEHAQLVPSRRNDERIYVLTSARVASRDFRVKLVRLIARELHIDFRIGDQTPSDPPQADLS